MKPLVVANWKMNPSSLKGAKLLLNLVKRGIKKYQKVEVVICPPFLYLPAICKQSSIIKLGAQDCFWEKEGAFTGEISPIMLKNLGVEYVILGHSERRKYLAETDAMINKKIKAAFEAGLKSIFCIGETEKEREKGKTKEVLKIQLKKGLKAISDFSNLIIAYEPVWAIGTGKACGIEEAREVLQFLKKNFKNNLILYGGSVNSQNAKDYIEKAGFEGLLVGGASLDPEEFIKIVENIKREC